MLSKDEIIERLDDVFRDVFDDDTLEVDEKVYQRIRMSVSTVERQSVLSTGRTHGRERHET